jgi:mono/diheme cytochrome c family protein
VLNQSAKGGFAMVKEAVRVWSVGSGVLTGILLWGACASATTAAEAGKMYFRQYCATCHGISGKGDGPMAGALKAKMPDLTQLAKKNGGKFPYMDVLDTIDGTRPVASHGSKEMPAWGSTFQADIGQDTMMQAEVRGRLMLLTDYLRSLQER